MLITLFALTAGMTVEAPGFAEGTTVSPDSYRVETVAEGLVIPWNISWLPNGDMLVTERPGRLRVVRDGVLLDQPVAGLPEVYARGQSGLFEAEPHPDFAENGYIYLTYSSGPQRKNTLTLARGKYAMTKDGARLENVEVLFRAKAERRTSAHYGGRLAWLPDGTLLLTSGEGYSEKNKAQTLDNHFGKVLRLTAEGKPASDNPYVDERGALPEIYSYGHRNPQGIAVGPDGTIYENEHGAKGGDEINIIEPGVNYGWPAITYGIDYSGAEITPYKELPGMAQPMLHWTPSIAPSALLYYSGTDFPAWNGKLLSSALAKQHVRITDPTDATAEQFEILGELNARIRDVAQSPDGTLYVATEAKDGAPEGKILAILPQR